MIDNLAGLLTYNSFSAVEKFLHDFVNVLSMNGQMAIPLVVDKERNQALYEMARALCKREVNINEVPTGLPDGDMERRSRRISDSSFNGVNH
jgi:archaellum biogenesis ATPase FlaH